MRHKTSRRAACFALLALALTAGLSAFAPARSKPIQVVATIPDLADFAKRIGGERVEIKTLSKGTENLHQVHVRPSMLIALSRADLFLEMGLSMEAAWLPELLVRSGNDDIQPGEKGFQNCSEGWKPIEVPDSLSRKEGHLHPEGNPHFNLDPRAGKHLATVVQAALVRVDPAGKEFYDKNLEATLKALEEAEARWAKIGEHWKGRKVCVYHTEFNYLAQRYGMQLAASIEPKPGIPPSPGDIARVVKEMREQEVGVILTAAWSNNRQVADIARKTGAKVVELPNQVSGADWATD
ncbi:MAG: zinc ABC transporter substrate-binding protein, partial [Planctomycetes bacterium]|nr:zinc ABC transporter substrate-binding protein [Planctomycetota bacterium]